MRAFLALLLLLSLGYVSRADSRSLQFDCKGTIDDHAAPLAKEPTISGEFQIDMGKQQILFTSTLPPLVVFGQIWKIDDLWVRFRLPQNGNGFGGIERTTGKLMMALEKPKVTFWLDCALRKRLF